MNTRFRYLILLVSVSIFLLTSCSQRQDDPEATGRVHLLSYMSSPLTRALPAGYVTYDSLYPSATVEQSAIHAFMMSNTEEHCRIGTLNMSMLTHEWVSDFSVQAGVTYYLYGFLPASAANSSTIAAITDYATGAKMTLTALSPILPTDLCAIVGVQRRESPDDDISSSTIVPGIFEYVVPSTDTDVYLYTLLDHLYAELRINLSIDSAYGSLRTICVKSCSLSTTSGPATLTASVPLTANSTGADPIGTVTYTGDGTTGGGCSLILPTDGITLTREAQTVYAYLCPGATATYRLTTTYDVLDTSGKKIRQNCTAENTFTLTSVVRGNAYTLNANVNPTYLYQLSDPDFDNPTIIMQ